MYDLFLILLAAVSLFLLGICIYLLMSLRAIRRSMGGYSIHELEALHESIQELLMRSDDSSLRLSEELKRQEFVLKELLNLVDRRKTELEQLIESANEIRTSTTSPQRTTVSRDDIAFYLERGFTPAEIAQKTDRPLSEISLLCSMLTRQVSAGTES